MDVINIGGGLKNKQQGRISPITSQVERLNLCVGMIGTNRTGKTSVAIELAKKWRESRPDGEIIVFDPQEKFTEVLDFTINPTDPDWAYKCMNHHNSLVILDDYKALNDKNIPQKGLSDLLIFRNQNNIDIIYICHSPALVLNLLAYYSTHYYIFHTLNQPGNFEKKIPNYAECLAASKIVNKWVKANGRGEYPNFPHCVVNTETGEVKAYNMGSGSI